MRVAVCQSGMMSIYMRKTENGITSMNVREGRIMSMYKCQRDAVHI